MEKVLDLRLKDVLWDLEVAVLVLIALGGAVAVTELSAVVGSDCPGPGTSWMVGRPASWWPRAFSTLGLLKRLNRDMADLRFSSLVGAGEALCSGAGATKRERLQRDGCGALSTAVWMGGRVLRLCRRPGVEAFSSWGMASSMHVAAALGLGGWHKRAREEKSTSGQIRAGRSGSDGRPLVERISQAAGRDCEED